MLKKKLWIIGLSLVALSLSPALQAAAAAAAAKTEPAKGNSADAPADKADKPGAAADDKTEEAPTAGHKSPALAGGLAFFPGVAIHGVGHMYAHSWMKGLGLLVIEGASVAVAVNSASGIANTTNLYGGGKSVPTDVSGIEINAGAIIVSSMAFLWTWFDDMAGAPIAASEYNKLQDQSTAQWHLTPKGDGAVLALSTNF